MKINYTVRPNGNAFEHALVEQHFENRDAMFNHFPVVEHEAVLLTDTDKAYLNRVKVMLEHQNGEFATGDFGHAKGITKPIANDIATAYSVFEGVGYGDEGETLLDQPSAIY